MIYDVTMKKAVKSLFDEYNLIENTEAICHVLSKRPRIYNIRDSAF